MQNVHAKKVGSGTAPRLPQLEHRSLQRAINHQACRMQALASMTDKDGEWARQQFHVASSSQGCPEVRPLLVSKSRRHVNTVTDEGWTALHYASIRGDEKNHHNVCWNMDVGHILLAHGADVNEHSQEDGAIRWTPLHCTAYAGHSAAAKL